MHASGFGQVVNKGGFAGNLSKVELQISPQKDCAPNYINIPQIPEGITSSLLCTVDPTFAHKSTCKVWIYL